MGRAQHTVGPHVAGLCGGAGKLGRGPGLVVVVGARLVRASGLWCTGEKVRVVGTDAVREYTHRARAAAGLRVQQRRLHTGGR
jgi:hypothetical protein